MKNVSVFIMYFLVFSSAHGQIKQDTVSPNLDRWLDMLDVRTQLLFTEFRYDRFVSEKVFTSAKNDTTLILNMTIMENGRQMKENKDSVFNNKLNLYIQKWLYTIFKDTYIHVDGDHWHPTISELQLVINNKNLGKVTNRFFNKMER
jgi:hypothetical protein